MIHFALPSPNYKIISDESNENSKNKYFIEFKKTDLTQTKTRSKKNLKLNQQKQKYSSVSFVRKEWFTCISRENFGIICFLEGRGGEADFHFGSESINYYP